MPRVLGVRGRYLPGLRPHCSRHSSGAVKLPPPSPRKPSDCGDGEQRGLGSQWQQGSAGSRQSPSASRTLAASVRWRRGKERSNVRGGALGKCSGSRDLVSADSTVSVDPLLKYWGPSLSPAEDEEDSFSILAACAILLYPEEYLSHY
ncbi:hypothetical protein HJG60_008358 [Phyllostomus discolor]|uniref:Uncharacterized protein n=1 Tax=Phyllostomus discolor TaxID=89673 RepID=A0A834DQB7_9CHIR|nr:hypothetical protein HJG60_008358 [Phyllostomus discolor]